jgi:hypothetical protein
MLAGNIGVAVDTDFIPELTAQKLVQGNTVCLAGQVPQCNFNTADTAALTGGTTELLDFPENFVQPSSKRATC